MRARARARPRPLCDSSGNRELREPTRQNLRKSAILCNSFRFPLLGKRKPVRGNFQSHGEDGRRRTARRLLFALRSRRITVLPDPENRLGVTAAGGLSSQDRAAIGDYAMQLRDLIDEEAAAPTGPGPPGTGDPAGDAGALIRARRDWWTDGRGTLFVRRADGSLLVLRPAAAHALVKAGALPVHACEVLANDFAFAADAFPASERSLRRDSLPDEVRGHG